MPHGHCYLWNPWVVWLHVISDISIGLAYLVISAALAILVSRIRDIPFQRIYVAFGVFIVSCGMTHFMDVVTLWLPMYWLDGVMRAITALASVGTAILLPSLLPKEAALAQSTKLAHARGIELEQAHRELGTALSKAREVEQLKTEFFANVSHELRTPLALILGPTEELLASGEVTAGQRARVEVVARNARLLLRHVNDLLDMTKIEAGKIEMAYAAINLGELVGMVVSNFDVLARERQIEYSAQVEGALPAEVDAEKVQRVIINLLSNAFKFTPVGGTIRCTARAAPEGQVAIEIADSGPGVPLEHRESVFERFRQLEGGATRRFGGTGLGLAIVRDFVEMHGGKVTVIDAPEGGALFRVELPASAPPGAMILGDDSAERRQTMAREAVELGGTIDALRAPSEERSELSPEARLDENGAAPPLLLVVEDNPEMNQFIAEVLSTEFQVATALDGRKGLEQALALKPDLIVSDVMMPELSGDELVREVRRHRELDSVPIVLLTAKTDDELRVKLLREGAQDYLQKPFAAEELRARVSNLVKMKRTRDILQRGLASQPRDLEALATEVAAKRRELEEKVSTIERQRLAIRELSTPIIEVWDRVLCLPIVGIMDSSRSADITEALLRAVVDSRARYTIIDVTGIDVMDTAAADYFIRMARSVRLLGAECVLTGINPKIAQTLVHMDAVLEGIATHRTLQDALQHLVAHGRVTTIRSPP